MSMTPRPVVQSERNASVDSAGNAASLLAAVSRQQLRVRMFGEAYGAPVGVTNHRLERVVGHGGMGVVFSAIDERTQQRVALKVLHQSKSKAPQQLKREFRALADLSHPNLVCLHELYLEGGAPFFTMELIQGEDLRTYLRATGRLELARLHLAVPQLVDAVNTLHRAGRLHRDLKPSNLLVQPDGRLVVLDFGLSHAAGEECSAYRGTPAYLAPEQWLEQRSSAASDLYSIGVILYEAFTGELPYQRVEDLVAARPLEIRPLLASGAAPNVAALTLRLLSHSPTQRPGIRNIAAEFRRHPQQRERANLHPHPGNTTPFVGRGPQLQRLWDLFTTVEDGQAAIVRVHGEPGIGKTALVTEFLRRLAGSSRAAILVSRCREREYISYNAVDGLIDSIVQYMQSSPLWPESGPPPIEGAAELGRLFPVLLTLPGFRPSLSPESAIEPHRSRLRAFEALRLVLQQISALQPLVVHFDDLQWGDADSAEMLAHALSPRLPHMMVIASYRTDASSPKCIRLLANEVSAASHEIALQRLDSVESLILAKQVGGGSLSQAVLQTLSDEAAGSPLFLQLLVQHQRHGRSAERASGLRGALQRLIDDLPPPRRMLLEILAVSGARLDKRLLLGVAAELGAPTAAEHLFALLQTGLVRTASLDERCLEPYHQHLIDAVIASTAHTNSIDYHRVLASTVARTTDPDADFVAHHFEQAGELHEAVRFAELAGDRALAGLALEHASQLYSQALRCLSGARPGHLVAKSADALAYIGRCAEAAPLYLEAAETVDSKTSLTLRLHAAEMYLRVGDLSQGSAVVKPVFRAIGLHYPITKAGARFALLSTLLRLQLRTRDLTPSNRVLSERESLRVSMCFELGRVLSLVAHPCPTSLLLRSLLIALNGGSAVQLSRGFASYAWVLAAFNPGSSQRQDELLATAWDLARGSDDVDACGWTLFCRAVVSTMRCDFRLSCQQAERASEWIGKHCADSGWILTELESGPLTNLFLMGALDELDTASTAALERAQKQGNRFHSDVTLAHSAMVSLAHGQVAQCSQTLDGILARWELSNFCRPPALAAAMHMYSCLYRGDAVRAAAAARRFFPRYRSHGYMSTNSWAAHLVALRGTIALTRAFQRRNWYQVHEVRAAIRKLRRSPLHSLFCSLALADLLEAGLWRLRERFSAASDRYELAAQRFDELDMHGHAAAARLRQAELLPPERARTVRLQAEAWAAREGIIDLDAWARLYAPGPISRTCRTLSDVNNTT